LQRFSRLSRRTLTGSSGPGFSRLNKSRGFERNNNCLSQNTAKVKAVLQDLLKNTFFYPAASVRHGVGQDFLRVRRDLKFDMPGNL
jgi:hypothetical protein